MRRQVRRYRYCKRRRLHRSGRSTETRYLKSTLRSRQRSVQTCTESSRIPDKRLKNEGKKEVRSQKSKKSKPVLKEIIGRDLTIKMLQKPRKYAISGVFLCSYTVCTDLNGSGMICPCFRQLTMCEPELLSLF